MSDESSELIDYPHVAVGMYLALRNAKSRPAPMATTPPIMKVEFLPGFLLDFPPTTVISFHLGF